MGISFWSDPILEPKRVYRFILRINGIPSWVVSDVKKPSFEVVEAKHDYLNHVFYFPGRVKWNPTEMTLVDPIAPDASKTMMNMIQAAGYQYPLSPDNTSTISKANAVAALGNVVIEQIDADGNWAEKWTFKNPWIQKIDFGELKYEGDELVKIKLTLRFDWAEIETKDPGVLP